MNRHCTDQATDVERVFNSFLCFSPCFLALCGEKGTKKGLLLPGSAGENDLCKVDRDSVSWERQAEESYQGELSDSEIIKRPFSIHSCRLGGWCFLFHSQKLMTANAVKVFTAPSTLAGGVLGCRGKLKEGRLNVSQALAGKNSSSLSQSWPEDWAQNHLKPLVLKSVLWCVNKYLVLGWAVFALPGLAKGRQVN